MKLPENIPPFMIEAMSLLEKLDKLMEENEQYLKDNNKVCVITGTLAWNFKVFPRILSQLKEDFKVPEKFSFIDNISKCSVCSQPVIHPDYENDYKLPVKHGNCILDVDINHMQTSSGKTLCEDPESLDYGAYRLPVNCPKCIDVRKKDMQ